MNKYSIGDVVYSNRYEINSAVVAGIEMVSSHPKINVNYTLEQYIEQCDTYQYTLVYEDSECIDTQKDTLYETYLND